MTTTGTASTEATEKRRRHFVLDTNVLLHNPNAVHGFAEHEVVVPLAVIEELDTFKKAQDDIGRNARQFIRELDRLRRKGRLFEGVELNQQGGSLRIDRCDQTMPFNLDLGVVDNKILAVAHAMNQKGLATVFITKDINARVKGDALGIPVEDYEAEKVDADWLYSGFADITLPGAIIDELYDERQLPIERLEPHLFRLDPESEEGATIPIELRANEYLILNDISDPSHHGMARVLADTGHVIPITGPRKPIFGVMARNAQQVMALDLLLDDEVKLVSLLGMAGSGKTLLAMAAGMHKVFQDKAYDKLLAARPIIPLGRDIGFLPGDKDEKLALWMQPIFDNLAYLLSTRGSHLNQAESQTTEQRIDRLMEDGKLVLEPLTYIRGRSIPHQYMVVDEVQNLTPHEVKTIVSRAGERTKIVLTGDINQIDNPYLDASSNGLSSLVERVKGSPICGHVTLAKTERSELARLAAERL